MISADRDAMRELLELAAVPAQNTLNTLMGGASVTLKEIKEVSVETLTERLPHFSMVVEGRAFSEKEEVRILYFMDRDQAQRLISVICGLPNAASGTMDEIAVSAFREVLSQCLEASVTELRGFLARDMRQELGRAYLSDSAGSTVKAPGLWEESSILMLEYRIALEGVGEFTLFCAASMLLFNVFGMEYKTGKAAGGGRRPAIPVRSVSFPEFRYMSLEDTAETIGEDRGRIRDMSLDVSVRIGETICKVRDILSLKPGQLIILDKQAGSPADVVVKERVIGKGDVLVSSDNFAVRITEIVNKSE